MSITHTKHLQGIGNCVSNTYNLVSIFHETFSALWGWAKTSKLQTAPKYPIPLKNGSLGDPLSP